MLSKLHPELGAHVLVTAYRQENVDVETRLATLVDALREIHADHGLPIVVSARPRTRSQAEASDIALDVPEVSFVEPLGFFHFVRLEQGATCALTESGTVRGLE